MNNKSDSERGACTTLLGKDLALRDYLAVHHVTIIDDARDWFIYFAGIKNLLGNISNDLGFIATLLIKRYLADRFGIADFDATTKAQGAAGIDIEARTADGRTIVGELKTTRPYQPGFGAAQRATIVKDITRLSALRADYRFMFVTDGDTFATLCKPPWTARMPGVEIVDLLSGRSFICDAPQ